MDDMVTQSDQGAFTFAEFASNAKGVLSAYQVIGSSPDDVRRANAAMQILTAGTKSAEVATTVLNSAINELIDPKKRAEVEKLGVKVRDSNGKMRDFNDIMLDLAAASEDLQKADVINALFGSEALKAIRAYQAAGKEALDKLLDLGDTTGALQRKSATMAATLQSNLKALQTALLDFADSNLTAPLAKIAEVLNKLAEHPEQVKRVFTEVAMGLGAIAAVKGIAGIARIFEGLKGIKGGNVSITESLSTAGAMPVYVTNWGGGPGGIPISAWGIPQSAGGAPQGGGGASQGAGSFLPALNAKRSAGVFEREFAAQEAQAARRAALQSSGKAAGAAAGVTAVISVTGLAVELASILKNEGMTEDERKKAVGGAAGETAGNVAGAALGAFVGNLLLPGVGAIVGSMIGSQLGGLAGRWGGETMGAWKSRTQKELETAQEQYEAAMHATADTAGKTAEEMEAAYKALAGAGRRLEAAQKAIEIEKTPGAGRYEKDVNGIPVWTPSKGAGHYENTGANGMPVWVEDPQISEHRMPQETAPPGKGANGLSARQDEELRAIYENAREKAARKAPEGRYEFTDWGKQVWIAPPAFTHRLPPEIPPSGTAAAPQKVEMEGQAEMNVHVKITDERTAAAVSVGRNDIRNVHFNTGNAFAARDIAP